MADNTRRVLQKAYSGHTGLSWGWLADTAEVVAADPTPLFDAMVADGMLEVANEMAHVSEWTYRIPKPHVHEWKVLSMGRGFHMTVDLICNTGDCDERRTVPNTLPIEIPED
jgi:hypothetical protein